MIMTLGDLLKLHGGKKEDKLMFWLSEEDIQECAKQGKLGRELDKQELLDVSKGIDAGLGDCWTDVVNSAIDSAISWPTEEWLKEKEGLMKAGLGMKKED